MTEARQTIAVLTFRKSNNNSLALIGQVGRGEHSALLSWLGHRHTLLTHFPPL